jgi:hypothetical protein
MNIEQIKLKLGNPKVSKKLGFYTATQNIDSKQITHYFSTKPKKDLILLSLGLIPYFHNTTKLTIDNTYPFGFATHIVDDKVVEISLSSMLHTLLKNYNSGSQVGQDCITEIINYVD